MPSGNYRTRVYLGKDDSGKRLYKSFDGSTANEADLKALQFKAQNMSTERPQKTFLYAMRDFLNSTSKTLSITTLRSYKAIHRKLSNEHKSFCNLAVYDINQKALQRLVDQLSASHAPKTVRNYYGFICDVMNFCEIEPPRCTLPQRKKPVLNIPDEKTVKRLFEAVKGTDLEIPVMLAALVPMRRGEIVAASLDDLGDDNILHIHASVAVGEKGIVQIKQPKTEASDRYVKLPDELADKIRAQGYICNISIKAISNRFARALRRAGIEHFRFHDLRHAFVSIAHAAGIPDAYIMARGGWATSYTVNNVYRHVLDDDREKIEDTVNDTMGKLL
jgi:integrase